MKKLLVAGLTLLSLLTLSACTGSSSASHSKSNDTHSEKKSSFAVTKDGNSTSSSSVKFDKDAKSITTPKFVLTFTGVEYTKDDDGNNIAVVKYNLKNTSDKTLKDDPFSALLSVASLSQTANGSQNTLQDAYPSEDYIDEHSDFDQLDQNATDGHADAGATINCLSSYKVSDTTTPIVVHVTSINSDKQLGNFKLN